jgi:hypothetical protein
MRAPFSAFKPEMEGQKGQTILDNFFVRNQPNVNHPLLLDLEHGCRYQYFVVWRPDPNETKVAEEYCWEKKQAAGGFMLQPIRFQCVGV